MTGGAEDDEEASPEALLAEAQDPRTSEARLCWLASRSQQVARAVGQNPSVTAAALRAVVPRLRERELLGLLENPAWSLLVLEQPDFWSQLPTAALMAFARSERCPTSLLQHAQAHAAQLDEVVVQLLLNRALPEDDRFALLCSAVRVGGTPTKALRRAGFSAARVDLLEAAGFDTLHLPDAPSRRLSADEQATLWGWGPLGEWLALSQEDCPADRLAEAAGRGGAVLLLVARHAGLPPELRRALASDPALEVRAALALNPSTTDAELLDLIEADPARLASWVASRDALGPAVRARLEALDQKEVQRLLKRGR